ncbi:helix-turn-helix transcriptional regulator [Demequina sp. NBRC 110057]|uniref:helix-turn-helix transcriptional regulator n=1 Tax=Demequina sp. NBRC 110057 TaxID=1570346 RepID=UPI000A014510|nr:helix-turn-helix transcriptional regulator [Demequina sp. NBRC 110057]
MADLSTLGRRIRHFRTESGLTLDQVSEATGTAPSHLSLIENGRREPRLSLLESIAAALGVTAATLLDPAPPSPRAALEIELEHAQAAPAYQELGLPQLRPSRSMTDETLRTIVGLHRELDRRARQSIATPEQARQANTQQRLEMRAVDNYLPEIELLAQQATARVGHTGGALTHRTVTQMADDVGLTIVHTDDLPHSARCVVDMERGRIYIPPASIPGGHGLRSLTLQAIAHQVLEHRPPADYAAFLRQRREASYYAAACLMPRDASVAFLTEAKRDRNIAIEDLRDAFGVTHEAAALRFTNLATEHLGLTLHYLRVNGDGTVTGAYENDGLPLPLDATGSTEGEVVCRYWSARRAFERRTRTTEHYQYTDTPAGTFFESTQTGTGTPDDFSITLGVPYGESKWFRGRETQLRASSTCPDVACCRRPEDGLAERWEGKGWASPRVRSHLFAPLPHGTYPGVDDRELYEFLETHAGLEA